MVNSPIRFFIGLCVILGYMIFPISWKVGDLYIIGLGFDNNELGSFTAIVNLVKVVFNLGIGIYTARLVEKSAFLSNTRAIVLGMIAVSLAMLALPYTQDPMLISVCRGLLGFGGAMVAFTMNPIVTSVFPKKEHPLMIGIVGSAFNVAAAGVLTVAHLVSANPQLATKFVALFGLVTGIGLLVSLHGCKQRVKRELVSAKKEQSGTVSTYGMKDALKSPFNWAFTLTYTGLVSLYYVAFTFIEPSQIKFMMYAGVAGNITGILLSTRVNSLLMARVGSLVVFAVWAIFLLVEDATVSSLMLALLGFVMFTTLPAYLALPLKQASVTPKSLGLTFMLMVVSSDFLSSFIIKLYGYLTASSSLEPMATLFMLGVAALFPIGCQLMGRIKPQPTAECAAAG